MEQIYLLSIVANFVAGLALSSDYLGRKISFFSGFERLRESKSAEITLGLVTAIIGIFKLIFRSPGEGTPVAGDLLPAMAGLGLGLILLSEAFQQNLEKSGQSIAKAGRTALGFRVPVGIAGVVIAFLHFLLPGILFI